MSAVTVADAADDLLADMRALLARHSGVDDLDELRAIADDLTAALRRVRGRISRITKRDAPPTPPIELPKPDAAAGAQPKPESADPQASTTTDASLAAPKPERTDTRRKPYAWEQPARRIGRRALAALLVAAFVLVLLVGVAAGVALGAPDAGGHLDHSSAGPAGVSAMPVLTVPGRGAT